MLAAIRHATTVAAAVARQPVTFFDLWRELDRQQTAWAAARGMASLLAHLGVSLVERAVLDALCRALGEPLHRLLRRDILALDLGSIYPELAANPVGEFLPREPLGACAVRHTVGLGDPLTAADVTPEERVDDGLPQDLESSIRAYGLRYFKIKLTGKGDVDLPRLERIVALLDREAGADWLVTLDGNENFRDFETFRAYWEAALAWPALRPLWPRVLVVEQPVHRDRALIDEVGPALRVWADRPRLIVDESDGAVGDVPRALALGYAGASHKNCKGIVKGLANAAVLHDRRRSGGDVVLTGEDLANLGPVALLQDLAMMALLGVTHVERNGHHYYRGPEHVPERVAGCSARRAWRPVSASRAGIFPCCGSSLDAWTWARSTRRHSGSRRLSIRQCSSACPGLKTRAPHWMRESCRADSRRQSDRLLPGPQLRDVEADDRGRRLRPSAMQP
jgi:L-alanine-DL-glutamate epimerase-like enolase superfamily enzyme